MGDYFYNLNITKYYVKNRPEKIRLYSRTFLSTSAGECLVRGYRIPRIGGALS